eukprot:291915-Rhodomonas_salina.1
MDRERERDRERGKEGGRERGRERHTRACRHTEARGQQTKETQDKTDTSAVARHALGRLGWNTEGETAGQQSARRHALSTYQHTLSHVRARENDHRCVAHAR